MLDAGYWMLQESRFHRQGILGYPASSISYSASACNYQPHQAYQPG